MNRYQFSLEPLLRLRRHQRDLKRLLLADVLRQEADLREQRLSLAAQRQVQFEALRQLGAAGRLDVAQSVARHAFAGRLAGALSENERARGVVAQQLAACRDALIAADQSVMSLEKLSEKRRAEFTADVERLEARVLEDAWRVRGV